MGADHTLLLARHGQTEWNLVRRWQGRSDVPLNETGRAQALALAEQLRSEPLDRALVSPLLRARETAEAVAALRSGPGFQVEPRLLEMDPGRWEGRFDEEVEATEPEAAAAWHADPLRHGPPGGESGLDVARRVAPLLDELSAGPEGSRVLLVGHQFTLAIFTCLVTGTPLDQVRSRFLKSAELLRLRLPHRSG